MPSRILIAIAGWPDRTLALRGTLISTIIVVSFYGLVPLVAPFVVVASCVIQLYWALREGRPLWVIEDSKLLSYFIPVIFFGALSAFWTPNRAAIYSFVVAALLPVLCANATIGLIRRSCRRLVAIFATGMLCAFVVVAVYQCFEIASGLATQRLARSLLPLTSSRATDIKYDGSWISLLPLYYAHKNMAWLALMFWPTLLVSQFAQLRSPFNRLTYLSFLFAAAAIFLSEHETSKLALLVASVTFYLACGRPIWGYRVTVAAWVGVCFLMVPTTHLAYTAGAHHLEILPYSARHRLVIWGESSKEIIKRPIIGRGIGATRFSDENERPYEALAPNTPIPLGTGLHSHNIFLQAWHELGAIGAALLALLGVPVLRFIRSATPVVQPYAVATWLSTLIIASLSWSMLAPWFLSTLAFTAMSMALATQASAHDCGYKPGQITSTA